MLETTFRKIWLRSGSACAEMVPVEESSVAPVSQCLETRGSLSRGRTSACPFCSRSSTGCKRQDELPADLDLPRKVKRNGRLFRFALRLENAATGVAITLTAHFRLHCCRYI